VVRHRTTTTSSSSETAQQQQQTQQQERHDAPKPVRPSTRVARTEGIRSRTKSGFVEEKKGKKKRCRPDPVARERRTPDRPGGDRNPPLPPVRSIRRSRAEPFAHAQTKKSSAGCCGRVRQNRSCCARSKAPLPLPTRGVPKTIFGCGHPCRSRRRQPGEQRTVPKGHSPRQDGTARTGKFRRTTGKEEVTTRPLSALKRRIFSASNSSSSHSNSSRQYIRHQIDCANRAQ